MEIFVSLAFSIVPFLIGCGMISTGFYNRAEYEPSSFWGTIIFGIFFIGVGALFFFAGVVPELKDMKKGKRKKKQDTVSESKPDVDETERLITEFKNTYRDFFSSPTIQKNSTLQNTTTQIFWHILYLQKRRMKSRKVTMDFQFVRKEYEGKSIEKNTYSDSKYLVTDVKERISAVRTYRHAGGRPYVLKNSELAHYTIAKARTTTSEDLVICPNCGAQTTRENLLDGCDYCGTKFTVEDLGRRVNSFTLRDDLLTALAKCNDIKDKFAPYLMVLLTLPFTLVSFFGTLSGWNSFKAGFVMKLVAVILVTLGFTALGAKIAQTVYAFVIFPLMEASEIIIGHYSKKEIERRFAKEDTNSAVFLKMRNHDSLFSKENFLSNVQNKLAAIHYAESVKEVQAFAKCDLKNCLRRYENVIDMSVIEIFMDDYSIDQTTQTVKLSVLLSLLNANHGFKKKDERIELTLIKSADCKTEAVCAPSVFKCKNCGSSLSLLNGGLCEYCGAELDLFEHDWVISEYKSKLL